MTIPEETMAKITNAFTGEHLSLLAKTMGLNDQGSKKEISERVYNAVGGTYENMRAKMWENVWEKMQKEQGKTPHPRASRTREVKPRQEVKRQVSMTRRASFEGKAQKSQVIHSIKMSLPLYRPPSSGFGRQVYSRVEVEGGNTVIFPVLGWGEWIKDKETGKYELKDDDHERAFNKFGLWVQKQTWYDQDRIELELDARKGNLYHKVIVKY